MLGYRNTDVKDKPLSNLDINFLLVLCVCTFEYVCVTDPFLNLSSLMRMNKSVIQVCMCIHTHRYVCIHVFVSWSSYAVRNTSIMSACVKTATTIRTSVMLFIILLEKFLKVNIFMYTFVRMKLFSWVCVEVQNLYPSE